MNVSTESTPALEHVPIIEAILRLWLADPDLTVFCGAWRHGAVMELLPRGKARLTGQLYADAFAGLRDLVIDDGGHHVHLDLGRLCRACYIVAPSVCFGFRPSFELRLTARDADPLQDFGLGIAVRNPYDGDRLREAAVRRYFNRTLAHMEAYPDVASLAIMSRGAYHEDHRGDWSSIERLLADDPGLQPLRAYLPMTPGR